MFIRDLPEDERPLCRLRRHGAQSLSDAELLSVLLGAQRLDPARDLLRDGLPNLERSEKAPPKVKAAFELHRRLGGRLADGKEPFRETADLARSLQARYSHHTQERLGAVYLDSRNVIIREREIYIGTLNYASVSTRDILKGALEENAAGLICFHNHPSGNPNPSAADLTFTRRLVQSGELLNIEILDHLIVAANGYVSLKARGLM